MLLAPPPPPATAKPIVELDVECYRNFFLIKLYVGDRFMSFRMSAGQPLNVLALRVMLSLYTLVTYNGNKYDILMVSAALTGRFDNDMLKRLSDYIITGNAQPWMIAQEWGFNILELDHIDLIEVAPGMASLKIRGGRLHTKKMQDLPYDPSRILTLDEMDAVDLYCGNDLIVTRQLRLALWDDIETRIELTREYGIDLRSKSDAQIAEAAFRKLIPFKVQRPHIPPGTRFKYNPAPWLRFSTPAMQEAFARVCAADFVISDKGSVEMPPELANYDIRFDGAVYRMGIGGLHSSEKSCNHRAGPDCVLEDFDVVSYYPQIILNLEMFPAQMGPIFLQIFGGWKATRVEHKNAGRKKKSATFKILINGTFGKTGSRYSDLYAPEIMIRTTITGQLSLLMLIEMLYTMAGVHAVQGNTDGVVTKCHPSQVDRRNAVVKEWERLTGFETEAAKYLALFSRDVNSYLAFKPGDKVEIKAKGEYADPGLAKNPTNIVCVDAIKAYLLHGTPLETTIRQCTDLTKFMSVKQVQGGGEWVKDTIVAERVAEKRAVLESKLWAFNPTTKLWSDIFGGGVNLTIDDALRVVRSKIPRVYLGKAVRWYYGKGQTGHIAYVKNGNLVGKSEGAKPCMDLPDAFPDDIDYNWYINEARSMLEDMGV